MNLSAIPTTAPKGLDKEETKEKTQKLLSQLNKLQNLLYAEGKHAVLIILQGMDASGKDGAIRKVFSQLNPQGVQVTSFKAPTDEELKHDFLWRIHQHTPDKSMIKIFNRSHYEDVLITRVHGWCDDATAAERFEAINHFEKLLTVHNATLILKFYLHISKEEQEGRFKERIDEPEKHWKFNKNDTVEATHWDAYRKAYEDCFEKCNVIPWNIVPADQNWYKEYIITQKLVEALQQLNMQYPSLNES
jgi:PPK2 family polyphosphate:nucleotide phosphotransferase